MPSSTLTIRKGNKDIIKASKGDNGRVTTQIPRADPEKLEMNNMSDKHIKTITVMQIQQNKHMAHLDQKNNSRIKRCFIQR